MSSQAPSFFTRYFFSTHHKDIGVLYIVFAIIAGLLGGIFSLLIRMELAEPGMQILWVDYQKYNVWITAHGLLMIFLMIMPAMVCGFVVGFTTSVIPIVRIDDYGLKLIVTTVCTGVVWLIVYVNSMYNAFRKQLLLTN